jgi:uncharacterized membrane protein
MIPGLQQSWQQLRESLWFVPGLMVLGACGVAYGVIEFDARTSFDGDKQFPLLFGAGAEGSRGMLTAIAGSMLTVAALVFSLTLSSISQVSSQYSPRVLRNFMRDRGNQVVMGYFVAVFTYCLIVLGTIRGNDEQRFVPSTAVLLGLVFALGGVVALIYFIHHIAESLQTGTILQRISDETLSAMNKMFPEELGEPAELPESGAQLAQFAEDTVDWQPIRSTRAGYVQRVDATALLEWATQHHALLRIEQPIGAFVGEQNLVFRVKADTAAAGPVAADALEKLPNRLVIGRHRNTEQDVAFGIQQLVDIALKSLSPGINDTTTAIMAIDYLGLVSQRLASRDFPAPVRSDGQQPRVLAHALDFAGYLKLMFDLVRLNAKGNHAVFRRLLRALALTAEAARNPERKAAVHTQATLLLSYAESTLATEDEKYAVRELHAELQHFWEVPLSHRLLHQAEA